MIPEKGEKYQCACCGKISTATLNKVAAIAEAESEDGRMVHEDTHVLVCDICYEMILAWEKSQTPPKH